MSTELSWKVRDLIGRRELLRANASGARRMAERFDIEADYCNVAIEEAAGE
jgi:hypothetical protein